MFRAIASDNFPPFGKFSMDFPEVQNKPDDLAEVHIFTGVNGSGKTRLLAALAAMLGHGIPLQKRLKGMEKPVANFKVIDHPNSSWCNFESQQHGVAWRSGGPIQEWCGRVPAFAYHGTAYLSDSAIKMVAGVPRPDRATCLAFSRPEGYSQQLLQAITNLTLQAGIESMRPDKTDARSTKIIRRLEDTLGVITGQPFSFNFTGYNQATLLVDWGKLELPFDVLPDGLRAIIGWLVDAMVMLDAWIQGQGNILETEAVFLLDEVESHLHPAWQRKILPAFQRLFPKAQVFVATHSPSVISSLNHGWIHRLSMAQNGQVTVAEPLSASEGDSYISVLEEIMGLAEWYDPETEKLLADFRAMRDQAYKGSADAKANAIKLAEEISKRRMELRYVMGKELSQMERQLAKVQGK